MFSTPLSSRSLILMRGNVGKPGDIDENVRNNLTMLMAHHKLTQRAVADLAGIKPEELNACMTRKKKFGRMAIERLARALNIKESYLVEGETPVAIDISQAVTNRAVFGARTPIVSFYVAAEWDKFTNLDRNEYVSSWLPFSLGGPTDIAVRIPDDSMEPEFQTDSIVVLGVVENGPDGKYVLAKVDKDILFRKYLQAEHGVALTPLNGAYPVRMVLSKDIRRLRVVAVAVAQIRFYR